MIEWLTRMLVGCDRALGFDFSQESVPVVGDGKTKFSLTKRDEVGQVVAQVVSSTRKSELLWACIPLEGDRRSPLEIVEIAEKTLGMKINITFVDYEENKAKYSSDFGAFLTTVFADGRGLSGSPEELAAVKAKYFPQVTLSAYEEFEA